MNRFEYTNEINELAEDLVSNAMRENDNDIEAAEEAIFDYMLHETIDSHQWVIYYDYSAEVVQHSDNSDAYLGCYAAEDIGNLIVEHGASHFDLVRAFYAMYEDVAQRVTDVIEQYREAA